MFQVQFQDPRMAKWHARLKRVPRWAWIAFIIGAVIPMVALIVFIAAVGLVAGTLVLMAALVAAGIIGLIWKIFNRKPRLPRNNQIVVRSARVVDP